ncbi:MAG: excinuclease ABC subunit UvrC [Clostridiales bacterium]|nr:excinuclease ABC subunit UvrC [Clostridiales bacterium]MDU1042340.1 excinuclease ABC subunit UvrC [Clostridiales bacterium]MDU3490084.1 excinuclease ABC subunit UvrC [Clostridiales bacterium]
MFDIEEELKKVPEKPGVYIMHDKHDTIIYVGKAKILKRRVRQYFQSSRNHSAKIKRMVEHIAWFEYIITDSELEALVLESNLIKENRPKYNTMLKDDKSYPFIKVTVKEDYPRVLFSRDSKRDNNKYFGPYTSAYAVKETIDFLCRIYKIRTCSRRLPIDIGKERPCLDYHIGKCSAPCAGHISSEEYKMSVEEVLKFLKGDHEHMLKELEEKMLDASSRMEYEEAGSYRDLIENLKQITQKQKITDGDTTDRDVIGWAVSGSDAVVQVFFIRGGKLLGRDNFHMQVAEDEDGREILSQFIKQYYGSTPYIPPNILIGEELEDAEVIEAWLSSMKKHKVVFITPKKGDKEKLVSLATENAKLILEKDSMRLKREEARTTGALKDLAKSLGLTDIHRVEAFDISNTNGIESVGSMVVFYDGRPKKHDYRRFKIKTVKGPDDYKSMKEVLMRRLSRGLREISGEEEMARGFGRLPDLILMDGGRGQVNIALDVIKELKLNIPVAGMVKDDSHRTRGLYYNNVEISIDTHGEAFKLITRIQDEAHRFAIEYHKSLRSKVQVRSVLDEIEGIGPKRRLALMKHFSDIENIRQASIEELTEADGMTLTAAENLYKYFH